MLDQVGRGDLAPRHVDRHRDVTAPGSSCRHCAACRQASSEDPAPDRHDQAGVLGDRDERVGRHDTQLGVVPAQQRLEADDAVGRQRHDRLVVQLELVGHQRMDQVGLQPQPLDRGGAHGRLVHHGPALAGRLGAVHRDVGVTQQRRRRGFGISHGDPDAGRDRHELGLDLDRHLECLQDPTGHLFRLVERAAALLDEDGELVGAQPGHGVALPHGVQQPAGDLAQQAVAGFAPEAVVDALETVEVEIDDRRVEPAAPVAPQGLLDPVAEQGAVGQAGQRVVEGLVGELLLGLLAVSHVVHVDDDAGHIGVIEQVHDAGADPDPPAVVADHLELVLEDVSRRQPGAGEGRSRLGGVDRCEEEPALRRHASATPASPPARRTAARR